MGDMSSLLLYVPLSPIICAAATADMIGLSMLLPLQRMLDALQLMLVCCSPRKSACTDPGINGIASTDCPPTPAFTASTNHAAQAGGAACAHQVPSPMQGVVALRQVPRTACCTSASVRTACHWEQGCTCRPCNCAGAMAHASKVHKGAHTLPCQVLQSNTSSCKPSVSTSNVTDAPDGPAHAYEYAFFTYLPEYAQAERAATTYANCASLLTSSSGRWSAAECPLDTTRAVGCTYSWSAVVPLALAAFNIALCITLSSAQLRKLSVVCTSQPGTLLCFRCLDIYSHLP